MGRSSGPHQLAQLEASQNKEGSIITMPAISGDHQRAVEIEERRVHVVDHVIYHPIRESIVSVTGHSLQEIDPHHGATVSDAVFDLSMLSDKPSSAGRVLEHVVAVGTHHVAAVFQSRCLVVWDLNDAVLLSVTEVEKQQHKSVAVLAASLCKDKWIFYASEGSNSIKVAAADGARDPPKKISRKAASRSSQLTALAYESSRRVLAAGASDGSLQLWHFSEENSLASTGAKEEVAIVTSLFAAQMTQSPVVRLVFAATGQHASLLLVAYQNRVVEVWDLLPGMKREPSRVAVLHCLPPQAMDFAKKNGELSLHLDPLAPLLVVHWHAYNGAGSSVSAVEMRLDTASATPISVTEWYEFLPAASPGHEDGSAVLVFGSSTDAGSPLTAYVSAHRHRHLLPLSVASQQVQTVSEETSMLSLSASFQLGVDQYFSYQDVPTTLLQICRSVEESAGHAMTFQLQRYAHTSGETEKLVELPVWTNYQGRQLSPWKLLWNEQQSVACVQLRDPTKSIANDTDAGISYVLLEIKANAVGKADADGDGGGGGASNFTVTWGSPADALDVCFCDLRSEDAKQSRPFVMLVLASSGKSIGFQMNCDQVDQSTRLLLNQPVKRIFQTPIPLPQNATYVSLVGSHLLYVVGSPGTTGETIGASETIVLSNDDLSVPRDTALPPAFQTRANGEKIVDVFWNNGASQSTLSSDDSSTKMLIAVKTTQRLVVLSVSPAPSFSLAALAEYNLATDLACPQSLLWMAQTLLFVTSDHHVRFITPLIPSSAKSAESYLLCSLPYDFSGPCKTQLLSVCSDRLCYAVQDPRSLECKTYLRPIAVCEPLLLGFQEPTQDGRLRAILERDFLVFLSTGGSETRNPISERLLQVAYHDFGWTDTVTAILEAMQHPTSGIAGSVMASSGSGANATGSGGGGFKKFAHLSPAVVSSLLFHAQKWKDAVRIHLSHDPVLEEYALSNDDGLGSSSAKLPSRTGAISSRFQWLAAVLASVGQAELAVKCLDLAGDDLAIVDLLHTHGVRAGDADSLWKALQKDWGRLNPPLAAITTAFDDANNDLFPLLCCEHLSQTERRSRLLVSVRPLDKLTVKTAPNDPLLSEKDKKASAGRASILYWKRLVPEDAKDVVGISSTPHFSTDEPKNPTSYALFHGATTTEISLGLGSGSASDDPTAGTPSDSNDAKMTIGPFLEDEDAVVAYWRFEEGATVSEDETTRTLESMDTTKRENHLQILQFGGSMMTLATSSAPVDKGEDGKLQEAFSLRFPTADTDGEWGAKCAVRPGSTLDIGLVFDDDPYRRKLTFEAWVRNAVLFRKKQATENEEDGDTTQQSWSDDADSKRVFVARRGVDQSTWWEFGLCDGGVLFLTFGGRTLKAESDKITNAATWQHVAFSIDITSPKQATLKLFLQARCVATKEVSHVDANTKLVSAATKAVAGMASDPTSGGLPPPPSTLHLGCTLTEYEMTEVRVWATARTAEQLSDMKENYLGIAEAKRRMKIAIHQRNCQCEKCLGRRTAKPQLGSKSGALLSAPLFPSTPPPAARDRRRPVPKN